MKRCLLPIQQSRCEIQLLLVYQSDEEKKMLEIQQSYLANVFKPYHIKTNTQWVAIDKTENLNKQKLAGRFWDLFYTEIYLIYLQYLKRLLPMHINLLLGKQGAIICSVHERFYSNEKIQIVGFSRGFPFSHVIVSAKSSPHVLAHEIGHSCGLKHNVSKDNLMYPLTPNMNASLNERQIKHLLRARYVN
jgi:hypothetical protein